MSELSCASAGHTRSSRIVKHVIAGTAGHIDHGKTALVRALTGIETDRLEEEKRRGISIDIGFAHLDLAADSRVAFIDVPGHERFIKNMLAGVGGIDFVILVIAADESIKPQTREHFAICRLLQIRAGLIALTKSDLVDEDTLEVAKLEISDFVAGSFLENAPIIPVSSVTGAGIPQLRAEMLRIAKAIPARDRTQFFRMPVDRSFVMSGFGAVATGCNPGTQTGSCGDHALRLRAGLTRVRQTIEESSPGAFPRRHGRSGRGNPDLG
jgi:selenocysteine-specific elongation factor